MDKPDLTVADLRSAIGRLLDAVPCASASTLDTQPSLDMGSLCDDAESIRQFLSGDLDEPTIIWHESEHIGGILRAITRLDLSR